MPPWTEHDREMYDAIRQSELDRGRSEDRAAEIAARTVNKRRRLEGRTPNTTTQGTGNPHAPLEQRTRDELRNRARQLGIAGRSTMNKAALVEAIRDRNG